MRTTFDQPIAAGAEAVQAAFLDPAFYASLGELPGISAPEMRSSSRPSPGQARVVLGYRFAGDLNGPARRLLDPAKLTWAQVTEVDLASRRTEVGMVPGQLLRPVQLQRVVRTARRRGGTDQPAFRRATSGSTCRCSARWRSGPSPRGIRQNIADTARLVERYVAGQAWRAAGG